MGITHTYLIHLCPYNSESPAKRVEVGTKTYVEQKGAAVATECVPAKPLSNSERNRIRPIRKLRLTARH